MTTEELYEVLKDNDFSETDINQILKAKEDGYDICNFDIKISTERLREYRNFLTQNLKPIFSHNQLREIELGFIKKIDVLQYADNKYTEKEMKVLRKALESNKDINIIKKYGSNENEMNIISTALSNNLTKEDIKKYKIKDLSLINKYFKKKMNIIPYIDKGFNELQIQSIINAKKYENTIDKYINNKYTPDCINILAQILEKNSYIEIKPLFNPDFTKDQLKTINQLMYKCNNWKELIDSNFSCEKMKLLATLFNKKESKTNINIVKKSNLNDFRYKKANEYLQSNPFHNILFDKRISYDNISYINNNTNLNLLKYLYDEKYNINIIKDILILDENNINILPYINKEETSFEKIHLLGKVLFYIKKMNLEEDSTFIINNINNYKQLDTFKRCIEKKIDYKKVDLNLSISQLNQIINAYKKNIDVIKDIKPEFTNVQIQAIIKAKENDLPIDNLLDCKLNSSLYQIIISLEKYNKDNERKINIQQIINLKCDIKDKGLITSKLISNNLDDTLQAYKMISTYEQTLKTKEINIQK